MKKKLLIVFHTGWDAKQLEACRADWAGRYDIELPAPDDFSCPWSFDVVGWIDGTIARERGRIAGVLSSSDYPGATAAGAVATALGLPGTPPEKMIGASHKYYSRIVQREAAPESTPAFALVDPERPEPPPFGFPCFVKPVKGAFSVMTGKISSEAELREFFARPSAVEFGRTFAGMFNRLVARFTRLEHDGRWFIAEEMLRGRLVTVEGFALPGRVEILGVVDSIVHPVTGSFERFDYPSTLPLAVQERMGAIARRVVERLGLVHTMFNIEMIHDEASGSIGIIEVNPRICGQFADLFQKVDGVNSYAIALRLAAGDPPAPMRRQGSHAVAGSFPLRVYEPVRAGDAPSEERIAAVEEAFPGTLVWSECEPGEELTDFESLEDGKSFRYAVVNAGGSDTDDLAHRIGEIRRALGYRFEPVG